MALNENLNVISEALDRLIQEYKESPNLRSMLSDINIETQELETGIFGMLTNRTLNEAIGEQLDNFGTIVGQKRLGFDDAFYRVLLLARIGINTSEGSLENVISIFKILTESTLVHLQEYYPAGYGIGTNKEVDNELIRFLSLLITLVDPAGVRIEAVWCWIEGDAFAMAGGPPTAKGYSDLLDTPAGGQFGALHDIAPPFAMAGDDLTAQGFGDLNDPIAGGAFEI